MACTRLVHGLRMSCARGVPKRPTQNGAQIRRKSLRESYLHRRLDLRSLGAFPSPDASAPIWTQSRPFRPADSSLPPSAASPPDLACHLPSALGYCLLATGYHRRRRTPTTPYPVEVGTPVARRPPHRSRRAVFPHRALQINSLSHSPSGLPPASDNPSAAGRNLVPSGKAYRVGVVQQFAAEVSHAVGAFG